MGPEGEARLALDDLAAAIESDSVLLAGIAKGIEDARVSFGSEAPPDRFRLAYFAVELARYYTTFEHLAAMIEKTLAVLPARSDRWHQDLLDAAGRVRPQIRPAVIQPATKERLQELLALRHFLRNAYAAEMRWEDHLERHTRNLGRVHSLLERDLAVFVAHLRAAAAVLGS